MCCRLELVVRLHVVGDTNRHRVIEFGRPRPTERCIAARRPAYSYEMRSSMHVVSKHLLDDVTESAVGMATRASECQTLRCWLRRRWPCGLRSAADRAACLPSSSAAKRPAQIIPHSIVSFLSYDSVTQLRRHTNGQYDHGHNSFKCAVVINGSLAIALFHY